MDAAHAAAAPLRPTHVCGAACTVEPLFGNAFRCLSTGMIHICDQNCDQRVEYGRAHTICVISKKVAPLAGDEPPQQQRKRTTDGSGAEVTQQQRQQQQQQQQQADVELDMERQASKRGRVST
jgi:hypothetical protein